MAVSHVKSNTVPDWTGTVTVGNSTGGTQTIAATDLVRPGDWNSAHNQYYTLAGNTNNASTVSGTNVVFAGSNGVTLIGSNSSIGFSVNTNYLDVGVSTAGNTAGSTGTVDQMMVFVGSNGVTLSQSTAAGGSGTMSLIAGYTLSSYEPVPMVGASTVTVGIPTATSAAVSVFPFSVNAPVSVGVMDMLFSASFITNGTSSGQQTMGLGMALYSRNANTLSSIASQSLSYRVTGNNSSYTINQITQTAYSGYGATAATNSAGVNITSGYTGVKKIEFPINTLLTPGQYWLGLIGTNSTSSVNVGISLSYFGQAMATAGSAGAPMGSFSSAYTSGSDPLGGRWNALQGSWTSAGSVTMVPASMAVGSISAAAQTYPAMKFWST